MDVKLKVADVEFVGFVGWAVMAVSGGIVSSMTTLILTSSILKVVGELSSVVLMNHRVIVCPL